jgi:hypothetical protein
MGVQHYSKIYFNGVEFCDGPIVDLEQPPVSERRLIGVDYAAPGVKDRSYEVTVECKIADDGQFAAFLDAILASDPYGGARQADRDAAAGDPRLKIVMKMGVLHHLLAMLTRPASHAQRRQLRMAVRRTHRTIRKLQVNGGA